MDRIGEHMRLDAADVQIDEDNVVYQGSYYVVYNGVMRGIPVFVKVLRREDHRDAFIDEIVHMSRVAHPFVLEFLGYLEEPLAVVVRRYPVTLRDLMDINSLDPNTCFDVSYKLASALDFAHSIEGLAEHDLRPETVFMDESGNPKVCLMDLVTHEDIPRYKSPENVLHEPFNAACDVYTLGVMMWELFLRHRPFAGVENEGELMAQQRSQAMLRVEDGGPHREILDFASLCYSYNPEERPVLTTLKQTIMDIAVRSVVRASHSAEIFWKTVCSFTYSSHALAGAFVNAVRTPVSPQGRLIPADDIAEVFRLSLPRFGPMVSIDDFWNLCCWFPNFFHSPESFRDMSAVVHSSWYCRDEREAFARIRQTEGDSFVILPSTTDALHTPFTLCVSVRGQLSFCHITRLVEHGSVSFTCSLTGDTAFNSLRGLAAFIEKNLHMHTANREEHP